MRMKCEDSENKDSEIIRVEKTRFKVGFSTTKTRDEDEDETSTLRSSER